MREIQEHKIKIYEFPETDDEEENKLVKKIKVCVFSFIYRPDFWWAKEMTHAVTRSSLRIGCRWPSSAVTPSSRWTGSAWEGGSTPGVWLKVTPGLGFNFTLVFLITDRSLRLIWNEVCARECRRTVVKANRSHSRQDVRGFSCLAPPTGSSCTAVWTSVRTLTCSWTLMEWAGRLVGTLSEAWWTFEGFEMTPQT